jgi:hypothetical protein
MKALLHYIQAYPGEIPFEEFLPDPDSAWHISAEAKIGTAGDEGSDLFVFSICSDQWIAEQLRNGPIAITRTIVCKDFNVGNITSILEFIVAQCQGRDWDEIAYKLNHYMQWEFEDFKKP